MNGLEKALTVLPQMLQERFSLLQASQADLIQEIRLRKGKPVTVTGRGQTYYLTEDNSLSRDARKGILCTEGLLEQTLDSACRHSLYTHQEELRNGYITAHSGCRIGVCGTAVLQQGEIRSFREITSLCIRVSRIHRGCTGDLFSYLYADCRAHSALICGEPACGKTSVLLDLVRAFAEQNVYPAVIDERGELKEQALETGCDVLCGIPKVQGIEQAVRCLAPPLILLDELGGTDEIEAVTKGLYRGVLAMATVHCRDPQELLYTAPLKKALENGVFEYLVVLNGRERPGQVRMCVKTKEWLYARDRDAVRYHSGDDGWYDRSYAFEATCDGSDKSKELSLPHP